MEQVKDEQLNQENKENQELQTQQAFAAKVAKARETGSKFDPGSSNIKLATYDRENKFLLVDFKGGASYIYHDVPQETWEDMVNSESAGRFLQAKIKGTFEYTKVGG